MAYLNALQIGNFKSKPLINLQRHCSTIYDKQENLYRRFLRLQNIVSDDTDYTYNKKNIALINSQFDKTIYNFYRFYIRYVYAHCFDSELFEEYMVYFDSVIALKDFTDLEKVYYVKCLRGYLYCPF